MANESATLETKEYLTSQEVGELLGISPRTLANLRIRRVLPFIRVGHLIRFQRSSIEHALRDYLVGRQKLPEETPREFVYDRMRRRSKSWPKVYPRRYPTGRVKWVVDAGKQSGKLRDRRYRDTREEAETLAMDMRIAREQQGKLPFMLPPEVQAQANSLYEFLRAHSITFEDVRHHYKEKIIPFMNAPTVEEIVTKLIISIGDRRPTSKHTLSCFLREFSATFSTRKITDIKEEELRCFCYKAEAKEPRTKRNRRSMAARLFNYAILKKWATENVANALEIPQLADKEPEYLALDQVERLLAKAQEFQLLGFAVLAMFLGIRPDEIERLDWSDVHFDDGLVVVSTAASKIHERREVPINQTAKAWLQTCRKDRGPIFDPKEFEDNYPAWRKAAGIVLTTRS